MKKNIIILNGGPRPKGNTSALIKAFTEGAESAGHSVELFNLQGMNIKGCLGCLRGGKNPDSPCTQKDDMEKIYPAYKAADTVVLASPLYFWGFSGQLKTAIDRLFAVSEINPDWLAPKKECVMLVAAGASYAKNIDPIKGYYKTLLEELAWTDGGHIIAGDVMNIGDIEGSPVLDDARKLGASI